MKKLGEAGSLTGAMPSLNRTKSFLDRLLDHRVLGELSPISIAEIEAQLQSFLAFIDSEILLYSDVSQRDEKVNRIKNITGQLLSNLSRFTIYFDILPGTTTASTDSIKRFVKLQKREEKTSKNFINYVTRFYAQAQMPSPRRMLQHSFLVAAPKSTMR